MGVIKYNILFSGEECDVKVIRKGVKEQHCSLVINHEEV